MSSIEDFGFTFQSEDDILKESNTKSKKLYDAIYPFLINLKGEENMNVINWPGANRHKQIDDFIKKLEGILNDKES